ncbi:MAG: hypothetical protein EOO66_12280 [Methylobacterium sp.]|nr:MAG: hypothetical protein EOO66_12280 [Methylobacterium sp.]
MKLRDLILIFRTDADDFGDPQLWSDADITRYLNEAEEEAAVRKHLLYDDYTTALTQITFPTGTARLKRDPRMFEVTKAYVALPGLNRHPERLHIWDRDTLDARLPNWRRERGRPDVIVIEDTSITLAGAIERPYVVNLEGYRLPLEPMRVEDLETAEPEIAPIHHRQLVHWALHRGYQKPDSETLNPNKATSALADFEEYFGYRNQANQGERNQHGDGVHYNKAW